MRKVLSTVMVLVVCGCGAAPRPAPPSAQVPPATVTSQQAAATGNGLATCSSAVSYEDELVPGWKEYGNVALVDMRIELGPTGQADRRAKAGVFVRADTSAKLTVLTDGTSMASGEAAGREIEYPRCDGRGHQWVVWPTLYLADHPACMRVRIESAGSAQVAAIPLSMTCS
ncbi:hypothetical protein ACQBAU_04525 [Propionibacteriaceae bacterium Y2011]